VISDQLKSDELADGELTLRFEGGGMVTQDLVVSFSEGVFWELGGDQSAGTIEDDLPMGCAVELDADHALRDLSECVGVKPGGLDFHLAPFGVLSVVAGLLDLLERDAEVLGCEEFADVTDQPSVESELEMWPVFRGGVAEHCDAAVQMGERLRDILRQRIFRLGSRVHGRRGIRVSDIH
jgi:hypothetical protein